MSFKYYFHPHFIFNIILCLIYPLLRNFGLKTQHLKSKDTWGFEREYSIITGVASLIIIRYLRYFTNYKKFINETLFYLKLGNAICLYFVDIRLTIWYLFGCMVVFFLFRPPLYNGPTGVIYISSEEMFKDKVIRKNKAIKGADNYVFNVFYSNYSENCIFTEELFAKISLKYSIPNMNFTKIDVDLLPNIAIDYKITTTGFMSQLPVIILFKNGEVEQTYPGNNEKGQPYQSKYYREKEIIKLFDLESIYLNSINLIPKQNKQTKN